MNQVSNFAYFAIALILLLIITQVNGRIGGWLLLITVLGLVYNAHDRRLI